MLMAGQKHPHCRRRKVRSAPFPPAAKAAPAPLHPKGTSAPTSWAWALLLSPPRGARRGPLSVLAEKKTGRTRKGYAASVSGKAANGCAIARSKRKGRLGALRCSGLPRDGGRRIGACSDLGLPSGTLGSSAKSMLPSRGGWCRPRRGGHRMASASLCAAAGRPSRKLVQRADEGIRPYGEVVSYQFFRRGQPVCRPLRERQAKL